MAERFRAPDQYEENPDVPAKETKFLNLIFFMGKLFSKHENREVNEVDLTL